MVKSTESRKFARTTNHLSRIQGIASHDDIPAELLDDHRALEPPDPIPNSVVKRRIADGSVVLHHVRVGHRQAPIRKPRSPSGLGFLLCAAESWPEVVPAGAYGALCAPTNTGGYRGAHHDNPPYWSVRTAHHTRLQERPLANFPPRKEETPDR